MRLGRPLEEPNVRTGRCELYVSETLAANFRECDFDAALIADHSAMLHALVFAAETFPIGDRPKIRAQNKPSRSGLKVR